MYCKQLPLQYGPVFSGQRVVTHPSPIAPQDLRGRRQELISLVAQRMNADRGKELLNKD